MVSLKNTPFWCNSVNTARAVDSMKRWYREVVFGENQVYKGLGGGLGIGRFWVILMGISGSGGF